MGCVISLHIHCLFNKLVTQFYTTNKIILHVLNLLYQTLTIKACTLCTKEHLSYNILLIIEMNSIFPFHKQTW